MNSEINNLKRITLSLTDIQICLEYLEKILIFEENDIIYRALSEAIIISYVRPFSGYNKKHHPITDLKKEFKKEFDKNETKIHDRVCHLRNEIIAHSDSKSYGVTLHVTELDTDCKMLIPIQRRIPLLLSNEDVKILKKCSLKIERYLFDEQVRIKNILPPGNY